MILTGLARLGRDAELRYTQGGDAVSNLSLAYNYGMKQQDGNRPTQWVEASLWGKQAEALQPYLVKGGQVVVTLRDVRMESFQRQDGSTGMKLVGTVLQIELAGSRQDNAGGQQAQPRTGQQQPQSTSRPQQSAPRPQSQPAQQPQNDFDDDIPF